MSTNEVFLVAMLLIFAIPYLMWRTARTDYYAPLVVVQIIVGILLGPGVLGAVFPQYYSFVFSPAVVQSLTGIAWWGVMGFVWLAGIELDLRSTWQHRHESGITAGLALGVPLLAGCLVALGLAYYQGWMGPHALTWQFVLGVGMCCAVTALPVLVLLLEKLAVLREPIGQRILRYASMDDIAIWGVLALILMDWERVGWQTGFLFVFAAAAIGFRRVFPLLSERDRWYTGLIWLVACSLGAEWAGLHFMVGAFLSGAAMDRDWFELRDLDALRRHVLLLLMPVYFLSAGLRTTWELGGTQVFLAAGALFVAATAGKLIGTALAGKALRWQPGEPNLVGWLLQTKGLIMIVFANVLLDEGIIAGTTFTALLLMAIASTMLTVPMVAPVLQRLHGLTSRSSYR